jgi:MFS family permease
MEFGFVLFALGEYGVWLAVMVYAFERGGTTNAALIAALQLVPAAIVAPVVARITDRRGGLQMLLVGYVLQAAAIAETAAAMLTHSSTSVVYAGAVVTASAVTFTRPAQASALAMQVEHPEELTAANVLNGWADRGALLGGPALAGVLIGIDGSGLALAVFGGGLVLAAALVAPLGLRSGVGAPTPISSAPAPEVTVDAALAKLSAGPERQPADRRRALTTGPVLAVVGVMAAQYVALGALDVLVVVLAVHTLGLAASFAGYLDASFGIGGVIGAVATLRLVGASSLARPLCFAAVAWGLSFALLGGYPTLATALGLLATAGLSHAIVDTAGRALLARVTPLSRLGRVFGMLEGMTTAALAVGALLVPLFFGLGGVRLALIGVSVLLVSAVLLPLRHVRAADRHAPAIDGLRRLHGHPLFALLALPSLEELARDLAIQRVDQGTQVVRQGEAGEDFYLIAEGEFEVAVDGRRVRHLRPGEGFGEIALLHNLPRTASVTARTSAIVYALGRRPFLSAMGASPPRVSLPGHAELQADKATDADPEPSGTVRA